MICIFSQPISNLIKSSGSRLRSFHYFFGKHDHRSPNRPLARIRYFTRSQLLGTDIIFGRASMNSPVIKRSVIVASHKTSVSLEDAFWKALKEVAAARGTTLSELVTSIDVERRQNNLSSCLRLFVLDFYRAQFTTPMGARNDPAELRVVHSVRSAAADVAAT